MEMNSSLSSGSENPLRMTEKCIFRLESERSNFPESEWEADPDGVHARGEPDSVKTDHYKAVYESAIF